MITYELFHKMKYYAEERRLSAPQIAKELSLDRRTVSRWLGQAQFKPKNATLKTSKLDPFKATILRMLEQHPYSAQQVLQKIQEDGFGGSYTIVREYVHKIRPKHKPAFLTLSFAPGECAQVDWGSFGSIAVGDTQRRLSFFVMVLCYSRMMYVEFALSQTMEHFLACHQNAFQFFGGVPESIMLDNLKSAVLLRLIGQAPTFNPRYLDFAKHYGFTIKPCGVGKGNEKGRVENGVGYVKKNFLAGLALPPFEALNPAAKHWLDTISNVRIHGKTHKQPVALFQEERLKPLPENTYDIATIRTVRASSQFRIPLDTNKYSVPAEYAHQPLTLKIYPDRLCLYAQQKLIARHVRSYERHQDFEHPDHPKALLAQRKNAREQKLFARFLAISRAATLYYQGLTEKRMNPKHHVQKIVALSEIYGIDAVARALEDALELQAYSCEYITNLLETKTNPLPEPPALQLTRRIDLLEISLPEPDLNLYEEKAHDKTARTTEIP